MKAITSSYKNKIKEFGRELNSKITYTLNNVEIELGSENLNSITPHFESSILKSVMKQLDIDSNIEIPEGTIINYQFGVKVGNSYEYINYGNYIVYKVEKQEDTKSYKITCYDKMLYSMKDYEDLEINFPITIRNYINAICTKIGLTFKNASDTFANYNREIANELYLDSDGNSLGYTFRDVLDELAQTTGSTICINEANDNLEIRYINETNDTINEQYLKDINVSFGEKYGPVNSIVLSRASESDNVYLQDEESVEENGLCEIKIKDNQIMNFNDRSDYLPDLLDALDGLEYYLNDFSSTGITYYELCDKYNISIGNNTYPCIMFNDEVNITQGIEENVHTDMPEESETDYKKADKTDRKINQTYIMVNKQEGEIQALASKVVDLSKTKTGVGQVTLENAHEGQLHQLEITGNISLLFPNDSQKYGYSVIINDNLTISENTYISSGVPYENDILYPSSTLFPKDTYLQVDDNYYHLDLDYLNYLNATACDKYVYRDGKQWIERNVGIDNNGNMYALSESIIENREDINILVNETSTLKLLSFENGTLKVEYLLKNDYTDIFATEAYVDSEIKQTANEIDLKVEAKVDEDEIIAKLNLAVEDGQGIIELKGNTVTIDSDNFKLDKEGNINCNDSIMNNATMNNINVQNGNIYLDSTPTETPGNYLPPKRIRVYNSSNSERYLDISSQQIQVKKENAQYTQINPASIFCEADNSGMSVELDASNGISVVGNSTYTSIKYNSISTPGSVSASSFVNTSLESTKKNFNKLDKALDIIKEADIYSYNWKDEKKSDKKHYGLVIGEDYNTPKEFMSNDEKGIDIYATLSICLQAIKEQQNQIEELKKEVQLLKEEKNGKDKLSK